MDCEQLRATCDPDEGLAPAARLHLAACDGCAAWWRRQQRLVMALRQEAPQGGATALADRIIVALPTRPGTTDDAAGGEASERPSDRRFRRRPAALWFAPLMAAAACLVAMVQVGPVAPLGEKASEPMTDADIREALRILSQPIGDPLLQDLPTAGLYGELGGLRRDTLAVTGFLLTCLPGSPSRARSGDDPASSSDAAP